MTRPPFLFMPANRWVSSFGKIRTDETLTATPLANYNKMVPPVFSMDSTASRSRSATAQKPQAVFAKPVLLTASDTARTALVKVLRASLQHIVGNLEVADQGTSPETVHQLRVAVGRMRALLSAFRKTIDDKERLFLSGELKWFQQQLGPAREWDVSIEQVLAPLAKQEQSSKGIARLRELANLHRTAAHHHAGNAIHSRRLQRLLQRLERLLALLPHGEKHGESSAARTSRAWNTQQRRLAQPILKLTHKTLKARHVRTQALGNKVTNLDDDELHKLRIRVRKLRYTSELFCGVWRKKGNRKTTDRYLACLKKLQFALGSAHDSTVAIRLIESIRSEAGTECARDVDGVCARIAARHAHDREQLHELWRQFVKIEKFWKEK